MPADVANAFGKRPDRYDDLLLDSSQNETQWEFRNASKASAQAPITAEEKP